MQETLQVNQLTYRKQQFTKQTHSHVTVPVLWNKFMSLYSYFR